MQKLLITLLASLAVLVGLHPTEAKPPPSGGFASVVIGDTTIKLELARTPAEQTQGLSDRTSLDERAGMLFVFPADQIPAFWMKEMRFPIDIIWLNVDGQIVDITPNLAPSTFPQTFSPKIPIRYVLEVNAGFAGRHDLKIGDFIHFSGVPGLQN
ncbi:MAG: DUF192 domain-containing protein [Candidatus Vogelbacteria bacterium]|nr:DUF192 domain-containing protein [Candidatus Vogelbacteria bacterium]